jgi:hypothetical protein
MCAAEPLWHESRIAERLRITSLWSGAIATANYIMVEQSHDGTSVSETPCGATTNDISLRWAQVLHCERHTKFGNFLKFE